MNLSEREKEILSRFCLSNKQIGEILHITASTVQSHIAIMTAKKFAKNRAQVFFKALRDGDIRKIDLGFWDEKGKYHPDWYIVDLRKE